MKATFYAMYQFFVRGAIAEVSDKFEFSFIRSGSYIGPVHTEMKFASKFLICTPSQY
jgi:hypothetical protein